MYGLDGHAEEEVRGIMGTSFPKHSLHSINCIGDLRRWSKLNEWLSRSFVQAVHSIW